MDAARWERMQALFHAALDLPAAQRRAFLETACTDDPELAGGVLALLEEDDAGGSVLDRDLAHVAREVLDGSVPPFRSVGPYRILSVIGQGGMGVVYLAEREDLGRRAAIKVLRDASLSPARRERFAREEQTLAALNHPSIARLYDADVLPDGTPYFVMEYVEGMPLTDYCKTRRCTIPERLRLFRAVCEAVQYAHGQAVIHRDLKPSNILVKEGEHGEGRHGGLPLLLDFGIAKRLESLDLPADQTETGLRLMTPAYAAPEQLRGEPVGVYTDVYALGVILYELLAGRLPFDLAGKTPGQAETLILEREPKKPSAVARDEGSPEPMHPSSLSKRAWKDLDVLCLKAMHKDPQRRYPTVEALTRDLDHFLEGKPLEARPDTVRYRTGKFLRRNRRPVVAALLAVVVLAGLVVFYTLQLAAARDAALAEAVQTQRIQRFMLGLFEGGEAGGPADTLRARTLIDRGLRQARRLDGQPEVQAELYQTLGNLYTRLGAFERADSLLERALAQRRALYGADHPEVAASQVALGLLRVDQAMMEEAEALVREGLAMTRRHLPPGHPEVTGALTALGYVLRMRGKYEEAVAPLEEAVRVLAAQEPASVELSQSLSELATAHYYNGRYATSDSLNRLALMMDRRLYGERHPLVAASLINLGATRFELGYYEETEQLYRQALAIHLAYYGPDHYDTASNLMLIGQVLTYQERYDEALPLLERALAVRERIYGPEHPRVATTLNGLGRVAQAGGDLARAESLFVRVIDIYRTALGEEHYWVGIAQSNLASVYLDGEQYDRAEQRLREAVERFTEALSADHIQTAVGQVKLGRVLALQGRHAEAEAHLLAGYEVLSKQTNPSSEQLRRVREELVAVYEALDEPERAAAFRAGLAETEAESLK